MFHGNDLLNHHLYTYRIVGMFGGGKFDEFGEWAQLHQIKTIQTSHAHYIPIGFYINSPNVFHENLHQVNFAKHYHHQTFLLYSTVNLMQVCAVTKVLSGKLYSHVTMVMNFQGIVFVWTQLLLELLQLITQCMCILYACMGTDMTVWQW